MVTPRWALGKGEIIEFSREITRSWTGDESPSTNSSLVLLGLSFSWQAVIHDNMLYTDNRLVYGAICTYDILWVTITTANSFWRRWRRNKGMREESYTEMHIEDHDGQSVRMRIPYLHNIWKHYDLSKHYIFMQVIILCLEFLQMIELNIFQQDLKGVT